MSVAIKLVRNYKLNDAITRSDIGKYVQLDTGTNAENRSVSLVANNGRIQGKLLSVTEIGTGKEGSVEVFNSVMVGKAKSTQALSAATNMGQAVVGAGGGDIKPVAAGTANSRGVIDEVNNTTKEIYFVPIVFSE